MAAKIDVIVNRRAHHLGFGQRTLASVLASARGKAIVHDTGSLAELEEVAARLAREGTDGVLLAGGDGSYMAGTSALVRAFGAALPPVGFAPGGTVSTVARNWGFRGDEGAYASRLIDAAVSRAARVTRRPTLAVHDDAGGDRVGFIFGAGLVANFFDAYYAGDALGYAAAARIVARIFAGSFHGGALAVQVLTPTPATLTLDGREASPRAFSLVAASVVRDLGLRMHLLHRAAERTDRFHVVASALPPRALGPQLPRVLLGRPLRGAGHVDALARQASLAFDGGAGSYVLDGDVFRAGRVTVSAGPVLEHLSV